MPLAAYMIVVSLAYAGIAAASPQAAAASLILFVALLLGPAIYHDVTKRRRGRRHGRQ